MIKPGDIECIIGHDPGREGEYPTHFKVGAAGVTCIELHCENYGDHGIGQFYIYKDKEKVACMAHRAVAETYFFTQEESDNGGS